MTLVTWADENPARVLKSTAELQVVIDDGAVSIEEPGVVVDMPILTWPGGQRQAQRWRITGPWRHCLFQTSQLENLRLTPYLGTERRVTEEVCDMNEMTISKAARKAGVGVETIRFYERRELIEQPRRPIGTGFRTYPVETVQRIQFIRQAQELGFSLREIQELLSLRADPAADCADVRQQALGKLEEVNHKVAQLEKIRSALEELIAACPGSGALRVCSIMAALVASGESRM